MSASVLPVTVLVATPPPGGGLTVNAVASGTGDMTLVTVAAGALVATGSGQVVPEVWVADSGEWELAAKQPEAGDVVVVVGEVAPDFQRGAVLVVTDGGVTPLVSVPVLSAVLASLPPVPPPVPTPTHSTPTADVTWDGSDRHHFSADTTSQDVSIFVPAPEGEIVDREFSVRHRWDGGTGNTVTVCIEDVCPHQSDIVLAVGQSVRLRAIHGSFDELG